MAKEPIVIVATICALALIYFLPRIEAAGRKVYGRFRRHQRSQRQERNGRTQPPKRAYRQ